jgi:succinate dehydrogenase / fumarate reductase membrane anchor subunit
MSPRAVDTPGAPTRPAAWETTRPSGSSAPEPSRRLADYVVLRTTGLLLAFLVLGHFVVTHFATDVAHDDSAFVARRLSSVVWIAWDTSMLAAALAHGATGIRLGLDDYVRNVHHRRVLDRVVLSVSAIFFALGALAIGLAAHA